MNKFLEELVSSLDNLYYMYERYIWNNSNSKLEVLVQDNTICFYLYKNKEVIDEIILSFDEDERLMYTYVCIRLLIILLGNVYIYNKDNLFFNNKHKSYLTLIVNDDDILDSMIKIISMQDDIVINEDMDMILDIKGSLARKKYSKDFIKEMNNRIDISKKLLRRV